MGNSEYKEDHPRYLIPKISKEFYKLGWVTGTGGGISIRQDNEIYISPSGVQKERLQPDDLFVQDSNGTDLHLPGKNLTKSQCTPLFMCAYKEKNAGAVIHTHSKLAVLVTLLYPGREFRMKDHDLLEGIFNSFQIYCKSDEEVIVPIIENTRFEKNLEGYLRETLVNYPHTCAVLVRRHGIYVWGDTWQIAKHMCECFEKLFEIAITMKQHEINSTTSPEGMS